MKRNTTLFQDDKHMVYSVVVTSIYQLVTTQEYSSTQDFSTIWRFQMFLNVIVYYEETTRDQEKMGSGLLVVKSGYILFIKSHQFPVQINTLERERENTYVWVSV